MSHSYPTLRRLMSYNGNVDAHPYPSLDAGKALPDFHTMTMGPDFGKELEAVWITVVSLGPEDTNAIEKLLAEGPFVYAAEEWQRMGEDGTQEDRPGRFLRVGTPMAIANALREFTLSVQRLPNQLPIIKQEHAYRLCVALDMGVKIQHYESSGPRLRMTIPKPGTTEIIELTDIQSYPEALAMLDTGLRMAGQDMEGQFKQRLAQFWGK